MNQRYIATLTGPDPTGTLAVMHFYVPQATLIKEDGIRATIDCPIWCENLLVDYIEDDGHKIHKDPDYKLTA
jgi:hypothetical protein